MKNNVVLITSVIHCDNEKHLSYSKIRSVYSARDRVRQTIKTIDSVRKYIPNSHIVLIEMGKSQVGLDQLVSKSDEYIFLGSNWLVRLAVDSKYKGLGEAVGLIAAGKTIHSKLTKNYFKISGRYFLNQDFRISEWTKKNKNKEINAKVYGNAISTRLYSFSSDYWQNWVSGLYRSLPKLLLGYSIEQTLYDYYHPRINQVSNIGVEGHISVNGSLIKE